METVNRLILACGCKPGLPYNLYITHEADELLKKALTLSPGERAELARSLIDCREQAGESVVEAWNEEIARAY
jgi:hypothetical protein